MPTKKRMVLTEDLSTADPAVAMRNRAKGWDPYIVQRQEDGSYRAMSYEVIDSIEDVRKAIAPRKVPTDLRREERAVKLETLDPSTVRRSRDGP